MSDDVDPLLRVFVGTMNELAPQVGISVLVGGAWVTGTLIPPRMFMQEISQLIAARTGEEDGLGVFFEFMGSRWFPSESELEARGEMPAPDPPEPNHLHLRGARVFTTERPIPTEGIYVRVRLDHVAAWTVGELGPAGHRPAPPPPPPE